MKIPAKMLKWRRKQKRGAIMKPETFKGIEASVESKGLSPEKAKKVAGAAYWRSVKRKYAGSK
jgi:hypothetical protein